MNDIGPMVVTVIASVICLAMIAVLVSKNAATGTVLTSGGSALAAVIGAAVGPVNSQTNNFGSSGTSTTNPGLGAG